MSMITFAATLDLSGRNHSCEHCSVTSVILFGVLSTQELSRKDPIERSLLCWGTKRGQSFRRMEEQHLRYVATDRIPDPGTIEKCTGDSMVWMSQGLRTRVNFSTHVTRSMWGTM